MSILPLQLLLLPLNTPERYRIQNCLKMVRMQSIILRCFHTLTMIVRTVLLNQLTMDQVVGAQSVVQKLLGSLQCRKYLRRA